MLPTFELLRPATLKQALELLAETPQASPVAGGTNLVVDVRAGKLTPETVIDLSGLDELHGIEIVGNEIIIGAASTIAALLRSPTIQEHASVLHSACETFANTLIRNRATVGGNLANAAPCADTAPALLVLNAEVELSSIAEVRWLSLSEFLVDPFQTQRRPDELLTKIRFPMPPTSSRGGFQKMGLRKISCMAKVDVAVLLDLDEQGSCREARIALGAVAPIPLRAEEAEAALMGAAFIARAPVEPVRCGEQQVQKIIEEAARLAGEAASPRGGSEYKRQVVYGLTRRILTKIAMLGEDGETT